MPYDAVLLDLYDTLVWSDWRSWQGRFADRVGRTDREIGRLRAELKAHPCHQCPDREDHARWAEAPDSPIR